MLRGRGITKLQCSCGPEGNVGDEQHKYDEGNPGLQGGRQICARDDDVKHLWPDAKQEGGQDILMDRERGLFRTRIVFQTLMLAGFINFE